jgi:hypothetical protein
MPSLVVMAQTPGKLNSKREVIKATALSLHQHLKNTTLASIEDSLKATTTGLGKNPIYFWARGDDGAQRHARQARSWRLDRRGSAC